MTEPKLELRFHGRIIDSLGIQMYQSPTAALAELVANAWDADASSVSIELPTSALASAVFKIHDDGHGMTLEEIQNEYLNVGRNRRDKANGDTSREGRPVLGRKGIGKFAGFGIAKQIDIETISKITGEKTKFRLDIELLRGTEYISTAPTDVEVLEYSPPDDSRKAEHGTTVLLRKLNISNKPNAGRFKNSMARRFFLAERADEFKILVNGENLPEEDPAGKVQYDFPTEYREKELPPYLKVDKGWGIEDIGGHEVRWRFVFMKEPISIDEFRGISVFCGIKVAQTPFFFDLSGGVSGQHGQQYMNGVLRADFLDEYSDDIITTERQRINWETDEAKAVLEWGQKRVKQLLRIWRDRRGESKIKTIAEKTAKFTNRLDRLEKSEKKTVEGAIKKLASISTLSDEQFDDLSNAILTAWEGGRLRSLIDDLSKSDNLDEGIFVSLLVEAQVLNSLHVAEAVKAKIEAVAGLHDRIQKKDLENAVRDFIANQPWMLSPELETFAVEKSVNNVLSAAALEAGLDKDNEFNGRIDLVLSAGDRLLVVEFMRPGVTVDWDHLSRFERYITSVRTGIEAQTASQFKSVGGLLVADRLNKSPNIMKRIATLRAGDMNCQDWEGLLQRALSQWREFLDAILSRSPEDPRLIALAEKHAQSTGIISNSTAE